MKCLYCGREFRQQFCEQYCSEECSRNANDSNYPTSIKKGIVSVKTNIVEEALQKLGRFQRQTVEKIVEFEYISKAETSFFQTNNPLFHNEKRFLIVLNGKATVHTVLHEIGHFFRAMNEEYITNKFADRLTGNYTLDKWLEE